MRDWASNSRSGESGMSRCRDGKIYNLSCIPAAMIAEGPRCRVNVKGHIYCEISVVTEWSRIGKTRVSNLFRRTQGIQRAAHYGLA